MKVHDIIALKINSWLETIVLKVLPSPFPLLQTQIKVWKMVILVFFQKEGAKITMSVTVFGYNLKCRF